MLRALTFCYRSSSRAALLPAPSARRGRTFPPKAGSPGTESRSAWPTGCLGAPVLHGAGNFSPPRRETLRAAPCSSVDARAVSNGSSSPLPHVANPAPAGGKNPTVLSAVERYRENDGRGQRDQRLSSSTPLCAWPESNKRSYPRYAPCARLAVSPWSRSRPTALGLSARFGARTKRRLRPCAATGRKAGMRSSVERSRRAARSAELHCLLLHGATPSGAESFPPCRSVTPLHFNEHKRKIRSIRVSATSRLPRRECLYYTPLGFLNQGSREPAAPQHTGHSHRRCHSAAPDGPEAYSGRAGRGEQRQSFREPAAP